MKRRFLFTATSIVAAFLLLSGYGHAARSPHPARAASEARARLFAPVILRQTAQPQPPSCVPFPAFPADDKQVETRVLDSLNRERAVRGLGPLARAKGLTQAARRHSNDMAANGITGHTGSDGSTVGQRVDEACYAWDRVGEIIGWGFTSPDSMVSWWMNSAPHRGLILSTYLREYGAGYVDDRASRYRYYWTVVLGRKKSAPTAVTDLPYTCTYRAGDALQGSLLLWRSTEPCPVDNSAPPEQQ